MSSQFSLFPHPALFFLAFLYIWLRHSCLPLSLPQNGSMANNRSPFPLPTRSVKIHFSPLFPFHCKWTLFNRNGIGNIFFDAKWSKISSDPWNEEYILNSGWNYSTSTADATQFFLKNVILLSREDLSGTFDRDNAKQSDPKEG